MEKNINQIKLIFVLLSCVVVFEACSSKSKKAGVSETQKEIRLTQDRSKLDQMRKDVPEDTRTYNDEAALILNLFADETKTPQQINSKFGELTNRKREEYSKNERRRREDYTKEEKKRRETYLDKLKSDRAKQNLSKMSSQERNQYFSEQDSEKRRFFADESDARKDFESRMRQERQDFDAQMRDMRGRFDNEYRTYSKTYNERKKLLDQKAKFENKVKSKNIGQPNSGSPASGSPPPGFTEEDIKDLESIPKAAKPIEPAEGESN